MKTNLLVVQPSRSRAGFSLVEIVVAVGIVATVMVALLGMIPTGLNTVNEAADTMAEIRIANQILGELQMTEWEEIENVDKKYYFDSEGTRLEESDASLRKYTAVVEITRRMKLPGDRDFNPFIKPVSVKVSNKRGVIDFSDEAPRNEYRRYAAFNIMTASEKDSNF